MYLDAGGAENGIAFRIDTTANGYPAPSYPEKMRLSSNGNLTTTGSIISTGLNINGIANIHNGSQFAVNGGYMGAGSLTIGDTTKNYGGGSNWSSNTAGLLFECLDNTEIGIHDSGSRVASFMYYEGGTTNKFSIGRDMGWGVTNTDIKGNLNITGNLTGASNLTKRSSCIITPYYSPYGYYYYNIDYSTYVSDVNAREYHFRMYVTDYWSPWSSLSTIYVGNIFITKANNVYSNYTDTHISSYISLGPNTGTTTIFMNFGLTQNSSYMKRVVFENIAFG